MDVRTCDNVLVEDCKFYTGDDCIAGFDNCDVTVRNCVLNSACQAVRFGGNNVLIENCTSEERRFGFRKHLTDEEKKLGELTNDNCRRETIVPYSYYCDFRAQLRKPAEHIVIKNCRFAQARELIRLEFDGLHRWCCNRSLRDITYENCEVGEIIRAGELWGSPEEKVTCRFKNVRIACRKGCENEPLFIAGNFEKIIFEDCVIEGYTDPTILAGTDGEVEVIRSTPVTVRRATQDKCIEAHPWGVVAEDRAAGKTFKLTPN